MRLRLPAPPPTSSSGRSFARMPRHCLARRSGIARSSGAPKQAANNSLHRLRKRACAGPTGTPRANRLWFSGCRNNPSSRNGRTVQNVRNAKAGRSSLSAGQRPPPRPPRTAPKGPGPRRGNYPASQQAAFHQTGPRRGHLSAWNAGKGRRNAPTSVSRRPMCAAPRPHPTTPRGCSARVKMHPLFRDSRAVLNKVFERPRLKQ
jgi:hypothetical protein